MSLDDSSALRRWLWPGLIAALVVAIVAAALLEPLGMVVAIVALFWPIVGLVSLYLFWRLVRAVERLAEQQRAGPGKRDTTERADEGRYGVDAYPGVEPNES